MGVRFVCVENIVVLCHNKRYRKIEACAMTKVYLQNILVKKVIKHDLSSEINAVSQEYMTGHV